MPKMSLQDRDVALGAKLSPQRRLICQILDRATDHPDAEQIFQRARKRDARISLATTYRALKALVDLGMVVTHDFGDSRTRYEVKEDDHHDHLICTTSGKVIEFQDPELEALKKKIAVRLGYALESHSLELYGRPAAADRRSS